MEYIPQIQPWIDGTELKHLTEVIESTYITENQKTEDFVDCIKKFTGAPYAIAVANGTLGLVAALIAEGIGAGDEVLVPNLTFIASANSIRLVGAVPVFCDVEFPSGCISRESCEHLLTPATRAIMPVHLYNNMVKMEGILEMAAENNLCVIEDAAEAFATFQDGRHSGTFGHYGVFSFFANKTITCGEGGVILTDSADRYQRLYRVKNHGRDRRGTFVHEHLGYNFCFTDLQAAIGLAQLERIEEIQAAKKRNFETYRHAFESEDSITIIEPDPNVQSNYWFNNVLVEAPEQLKHTLHEQGIGTRRFFYPLDCQPCFADIRQPQGEFPISKTLYEQGLSLPSGANLKPEQLTYVCEQIIKSLKNTPPVSLS